VFSNMPGIGWILISLPQVARILRLVALQFQVTKRHR
jgi:hypothetical protein